MPTSKNRATQQIHQQGEAQVNDAARERTSLSDNEVGGTLVSPPQVARKASRCLTELKQRLKERHAVREAKDGRSGSRKLNLYNPSHQRRQDSLTAKIGYLLHLSQHPCACSAARALRLRVVVVEANTKGYALLGVFYRQKQCFLVLDCWTSGNRKDELFEQLLQRSSMVPGPGARWRTGDPGGDFADAASKAAAHQTADSLQWNRTAETGPPSN